jgi:hypothetical protein
MKTLMLCVTLLVAAFPAWTATTQEDEQDRLYIQCLIKRKVDPPNIPPEDSAYCLKEAGVEDPGDVARKEKGEAWRNCVIGKSMELDDGISPAVDIARAIAPLCAREWREYVASLAMYPRAKRAMANGLDQYGVNDAVQGVLRTRRVRREAQALPEGKK